jgi:hypothetical protein
MVVILIVTVNLVGLFPLTYPALLLFAVIGLRSRSQVKRQFAAIGCAALAWTTVWLGTAGWAYVLMLMQGDRGSSVWLLFVAVVVLAVAGPIVGALVGRRLWRRAEFLDPSEPGNLTGRRP